jgi:TPR repeat protein
MYRKGEGVSKSYKLSMEWYQKAASTGNINAQYNIGRLYYYGEGVREDRKQAMNWYLKAANNGNTDAMNAVGFMYKFGYGVFKNIHTAIEWYTKAANQGNAEAQCQLAYIYRDKDEVKDIQKAIYWLQKADVNNDMGTKEQEKELHKFGYYSKNVQEGTDYCYTHKKNNH